MKIKDCVIGAVIATAIFAGTNADTPTGQAVPGDVSLASPPGLAVMRVCVGQVLDVMGAVAALVKQL